MLLRNISSLKKNGLVFAVIAAMGLHYLLNPSESVSAPQVAKFVRLASASIILSMVFFITRPSKSSLRLAGPFAFVCLWFLLINFPDNLLALFSLFLFVGFGMLMAAYLFSESETGIVSRGLDFLLMFWVLSLLVQVLVYLGTATVLDLHQWLHPLSEARVHDVGSLIRFTGVLIEPGTYSNWVYGLVLMRGLANGKLFDRLSIASVLSILITLSAWGVLAACVYLIACFWTAITSKRSEGRRKTLIMMGVLLILAAVIYVRFSEEIGQAIAYLNTRSELGDDSGASKVEAYEGLLNILLRISVVGLPVDYDFCNGCVSPQDAGIFVNLVARAGIFFTLAVFCVIVKCFSRRYGVVACICLIPLVFAKYFYFEPLFWGLFGFCFLDVFKSKRRAGVPNVAEIWVRH